MSSVFLGSSSGRQVFSGMTGREISEQLHTAKSALRKSDHTDSNIDDDYESNAKRPSMSTGSDDCPDRPCLRSFTEPDPLSNVILEVEGVELHVHKEILAEWSPVFMAMFTSNFLEAQQNKVAMPDKSLSDVQLFLNCIYPPNAVTINKENIMALLPLINEYDVKSLIPKCEEVIRSFDYSLDMVVVACDYRLSKVLDDAIEGCGKLPLSTIDHHTQPIVKHIPEKVMLDIYREKIRGQIDALKRLRKEKEEFKSVKHKLLSWGTGLNTYPCESHRSFNEKCVGCLSAFRDFTKNQLKELS